MPVLAQLDRIVQNGVKVHKQQLRIGHALVQHREHGVHLSGVLAGVHIPVAGAPPGGHIGIDGLVLQPQLPAQGGAFLRLHKHLVAGVTGHHHLAGIQRLQIVIP